MVELAWLDNNKPMTCANNSKIIFRNLLMWVQKGMCLIRGAIFSVIALVEYFCIID